MSRNSRLPVMLNPSEITALLRDLDGIKVISARSLLGIAELRASLDAHSAKKATPSKGAKQ